MKNLLKKLFPGTASGNLNRNKKNIPAFPFVKTRPFTLSDLEPVPRGWRIGGPDFVGVGTIKAGTSWWYSLLLDHPQVVNNRVKQKEPRYFVHFGYKGLTEDDITTYNRAFAAPEGSICGEWSPIYLSHPLCTRYIAEAAPAAKILVILRNPVDRVVSFLNEAAHGSSHYNFTPEQRYVFDHFNIYPRAMLSSFYTADLRRLLGYFDRKQILVLQYEKCKIDARREIARTYRFLDIDERHQPQNIERAVNKKDYLVPKLTPNERLCLIDYFAEDVHLTKEMFPGIDLSLWEDFDKKNL